MMKIDIIRVVFVMILSIIIMLTINAVALVYEDYEYEMLDDGSICIVDWTGDVEELIIPDRINNLLVTKLWKQYNGFCCYS